MNCWSSLQVPVQGAWRGRSALPDMVVEVLQQHAPGTYSPTVQPSSKGNYHSVRVTVTAQSKEHIEAMYTALGKIELVRYVL